MKCQCQSKIFDVARIAELSRSPRKRSRVTELHWENIDKKACFRRWRKTGRDGDDWMSDGNEFQRSDAADWKCASTDSCKPEWWNKQLMWWRRAVAVVKRQLCRTDCQWWVV